MSFIEPPVLPDPSATPTDFVSLCEPSFRQIEEKQRIVGEVSKEISQRKVYIHESLTSVEQQCLIGVFPEYNLCFSSRVFHPHAFSAASRKLELRILLDKLHYSASSKIPDGYDDYICDIGGDFSLHLKQDHFGIHSCNPMLDIRDFQRKTTRTENLRRSCLNNEPDLIFDIAKSKRITDFLNGDGDVVDRFSCNNFSQNCNRKARYGICVHSSYDISLFDFADIMLNKGMYELYGSFIFSDIVLIRRSGIISGINSFFQISDDSSFIEFSFQNDSSMVYRHNLKNYLALITLNSFRDRNGRFTFVIELLENRAGIQFFKITRIDKPYCYNNLTRQIWLPSLKDQTKVCFFELDRKRLAVGDFRGALVPIEFFVDTNIIDKVCAHAYASTETKFRPVEIFSFLLAYNGRIFFGSDVCVRFKQLDFEKAVILANAIYVSVFSYKYDIGKVDQILMNAIKHDRDLSEGSLLRKFLKKKFDSPSAIGTGHSSSKVIRKMSAPLHDLLFWWKKSCFEDHKFFVKNVRFVRCNDSVASFGFEFFRDNRHVFSHTVKMDSVLTSSRAFDIGVKMREVMDDFLANNDSVVALDDIVPLVNRAVVTPNFSIAEVTLNVIAEICERDLYSDVENFRRSFVRRDVCGAFEGSVLFITRSAVDLINSVVSDVPVYVLNLDPKLVPLVKRKVSFLHCSDILVDSVSAATSLFVSNVVLVPDFPCEDLLVPLFNVFVSQPKMRFFSALSSDFQFFTFSFVALHVGDRDFVHRIFPLERFPIGVNVLRERVLSSLSFAVEDLIVFEEESLSPLSSAAFVSCEEIFEDDLVLPLVVEDIDATVSAVVNDICDEVAGISKVPYSLSGIVAIEKFFEIDVLAKFCANLGEGTVRKGKWGVRHEYLFSPVSYCYANYSLEPISTLIPSCFQGIVDLSFFNTLLVVFYPSGSRGLAFHKDDESCMTSQRVLTLSCGGAFRLLLKDDSSGVVSTFTLDSGYSYELLDQNSHRHAVEVFGPRFALTFRRHNVSSALLSLPSSEVLPGTIVAPNFSFSPFIPTETILYFSSFFDHDKILYELISLLGKDFTFSSFVDFSASSWSAVLLQFGRVFTVSDVSLDYNTTVINPEGLRELPSADLVLCDGPVVCEFLDILFSFLDSGGFFLGKFTFEPKIFSVLDKFSAYKTFRIFRPHSLGITCEFFLFAGGGSCPKRSVLPYLSSLMLNCNLQRQIALLCSMGARVEFPKFSHVKSLAGSDRVDLGGNGDCLFYCLSRGDKAAADALRNYLFTHAPLDSAVGNHPEYSRVELLRECASPGTYAGMSSIIAFSHLFRARVNLYSDVSGGVLSVVGAELKHPLFVINLNFAHMHFTTRSLHTVSVVRRQPLLLDSIDLDLLVRGTLVSAFSSGFLFFNCLENFCYSSDCVCYGGLRDCVKEKNKPEKLVVLTFEKIISSESIIEFMISIGYKFHILCVPGVSNSGFSLLAFSMYESNARQFDYRICLSNVREHVQNCLRCDGMELCGNPLYRHVDRAYYFCNSNNFVQVVSELSDADVVFKLVPYDADNYLDTCLIDADDCVYLPIKIYSEGSLTDNEGFLLHTRKLIDNYFSLGGVPSVGLVNCGLLNVSFFVDCFRGKVSRVFVMDNASSLSSGINFNPDYVVTTGDQSFIFNSMLEAREYYRATLSSIVSNLKNVHEGYLDIFTNFKGGNYETFNRYKDFAIIDMDNAIYRVPPKVGGGPYSYAYDGTKLVDITSAFSVDRFTRKEFSDCSWLNRGVFHGLFSVSSETKLINCDKIYERLARYDISSENFYFKPKLELIEGVPGCGKTRYIIDNHSFSLTDTKHVVLTASREAADDLRRRVAEKFGIDPCERVLKRRYRTIDSFLMHYDAKYDIEVLWLDEGLMKHFGDLLWCAFICGCKVMRIIGDRAQVAFHNRLAGVFLSYSTPSISEKTMSVQFLSTTYRCPVDVAVYLNRFGKYNKKIHSNSQVMRSVEVMHISCAKDISNFSRDAVLLTFTSSEKSNLLHEGFRRVYTINEFQGSQAEFVILVRENIKKVHLFDSENHMLVAISRHTKRFIYATKVIDDKLATFLCEPIFQQELDSASLLGGGVIEGKTITKQFPIYNVNLKPAKMIDMLKQDSRIRDFVQGNLGHGVIPFRVDLEPVSISSVDIPFASAYPVADPIVTLQHSYDILFPGQSSEEHEYDDDIFKQDDLYFATQEMLRVPTFERQYRRKYDFLSPSLRTSCPSPVSNHLKYVLKAFYDRNGNVPELRGIVDDDKMADLLFQNFVNSYVKDRELFDTFEEEIIDINVDSIEDWLFTQPKNVKDLAFPVDFIHIFAKELNSYNLILKKLPKPKLEPGAEYKFPSPQTIAHSSKDVNAVFCPIIREIKKRLISVLPPNVLLFSDVSVTDFEEILTTRLPRRLLRHLKFILENDIAKYDKSQELVALLFECKFLHKLGFPPKLIPTWIFMHVYSKLLSKVVGLSAKVFFQRKSGDPMTYLGNTVFLMAVTASCGIPHFREMIFSYEIVVLFSGDDFLAFCKYLINIKFVTHELAIRFNLEAKVLNFKTPYFCSKFLFMTPWGRWVMVPDVAKLVTKLGRRDLVNFAHVEEYRISCLDVGKHFGNSVLYPFIDDCLKDRYFISDCFGSFGALYSALFHLFSDRDKFRCLFYVKEHHTIDGERIFTKLNDF